MKPTPGHIAILGAGESGVGAAVLAKKQGWNVFVSDFGKVKEKFAKELDAMSVEWEQGKHSEERILNCKLIVKSPGIPDTAPLIVKSVA